MATWASDALPPADDDDATAYDDDVIPADGVLLQRGGTGPAGESIAMETGQAPSLYVVIHNIKSSDNVGQLIRTAGAFGAREVLVGLPNTLNSIQDAQKMLQNDPKPGDLRLKRDLSVVQNRVVCKNGQLVS